MLKQRHLKEKLFLHAYNLTKTRNIHSVTGKDNTEIQKTTIDTLQYSQNQKMWRRMQNKYN